MLAKGKAIVLGCTHYPFVIPLIQEIPAGRTGHRSAPAVPARPEAARLRTLHRPAPDLPVSPLRPWRGLCHLLEEGGWSQRWVGGTTEVVTLVGTTSSFHRQVQASSLCIARSGQLRCRSNCQWRWRIRCGPALVVIER
jgi:hypothetical protein